MNRKDNRLLRPGLLLLLFAALLIGTAAGRATAPDAPISSDVAIYLIGEYDGMVAVFDATRPDTPIRVTDIPLTELRRLDAEEIRRGIRLEGEEALSQALEDYIS